MWLTIVSLLIIIWLLSVAYGLLPMLKPPAWNNPFALAPYYDYDFMKNDTDTTRREGAWVGFLQEDVYKNRTGPIGEFVGNDSPSDKAPLYFITKQETIMNTPRDAVSAQLQVFSRYTAPGE
jgi:hypothetical protein